MLEVERMVNEAVCEWENLNYATWSLASTMVLRMCVILSAPNEWDERK